MTVTLKINKGTAEKLQEWKRLKVDQSRNITEEDLTLEIEDGELAIELHEKEKRILEISDANGSFGVWIYLNRQKIEKLKQIVEKLGP